MGKSKEYRALKNLVHNTNAITRDQLIEIVQETVKGMVKESLERFFETTKFACFLAKEVSQLKYVNTGYVGREAIKKAVEQIAREQIEAMLDITIKPKE